MKWSRRFYRPALFLLLSPWCIFFSCPARGENGPASPDSARKIVIRKVILEGNKLTRDRILLREMQVKAGDTLSVSELRKKMTQSQQNVFNTRLFNVVTVDTVCPAGASQPTDILVRVIEAWYIWPIPYFEISDRNINAWWEDKDFSRLTYGVDLTFYNVRGRNETLTLMIHLGFNQKYGFKYKTPYFNKKQTLGVGFGADYEQNHEVAVTSVENQPLYYKEESDFPKQLIFGFVEGYFRPDIYNYHTLRASYNNYYFSDSLLKTPGFATDSANYQDFFTLYYKFKSDHRDMQFYPLKGYYIDVELTKYGVFEKSIDVLVFAASLRKYFQLSHRWYFASGLTLKASIPEAQPYYIQQGLGYGRNVVRGYERYLIDGQHYFILKNNFKFAIVPWHVELIPFLKSPKFNTIPLGLYLNFFADMGYVVNRVEYMRNMNSLENTFLIGCGAGIDFITYYNVVLRFEGSVNGLGKPGFSVSFVAPI